MWRKEKEIIMSNFENKDKEKFSGCNKLISRGALGSSSHRYSEGFGNLIINDDTYSDTDIVGVSVNGARRNRLTFNRVLVKAAVLAGAIIIKDNNYHTNRSFNIGERELSKFLTEIGATRFDDDSTGSAWRLLR